ncbi:hypothetical protein ACWOBZ_00790 [Gemella bergeri]
MLYKVLLIFLIIIIQMVGNYVSNYLSIKLIPKSNLYENTYTQLFKIKTGNEEPTPQSVVWLVVFAVGVTVYGVIVHSAGAAVNVGAGANLWVQVSIKFDVYEYSVRKQDERVKNVAYTLFPDLKI